MNKSIEAILQAKNNDTDDLILQDESTLSTTLSIIFTSLILGFITFITIVGNVFVIVAIIFAKHLRTVGNSLILSLAIADLLVAVLVMPLGALYEIRKEWTFGSQLCDVWTSSDVLCCTASILHLLAIAIDRYWAVTHLHYMKSRTIRSIGTMIFLIWSLSIIVSLAPLLFGWKDEDFDERVNANKVCMVSQELSYQIFATMATFYVPLTIIILLYYRIFITARRRLRYRLAQKAKRPLARHNVQQAETVFGREETEHNPQNKCKIHQKKIHINQAVQTDAPVQTAPNKRKKHVKENKKTPNSKSSTSTISLEVKRERKTAKVLIIVTGVFIACWLPFFVLAILMSLNKSQTYNSALVSTFLWLGYLNSALNPIIYTVFSPEFRNTFRNILLGRAINKNYYSNASHHPGQRKKI